MRAAALGSANEAVPTWTALAPARSSSTASAPDVTPPTPTMAASGKATRQSYTARTATFADPKAAARILAELIRWCRRHHVHRIAELTGAVHGTA